MNEFEQGMMEYYDPSELSQLRAQLADLREELRVGNQLTAKFSDRCMELGIQLADMTKDRDMAVEALRIAYLALDRVIGQRDTLKEQLDAQHD